MIESPKDGMFQIVEAIVCNNSSVLVKYNCDGLSFIKLFDIETGYCKRTITEERSTTLFAKHQNRVLVCNYFNNKPNCKAGDTKIYIFDLIANDYSFITDFQKFKAEKVWLCDDIMIVVGTDVDFGLDFMIYPFVHASYYMGKEEKKYLKEQHKIFHIYNIASNESVCVSNKSEINIDCGTIVNDVFYFSYVNSKKIYSYDITTNKIKHFAKLNERIYALTGNDKLIIAHCENSSVEIIDPKSLKIITTINVPVFEDQIIANDELLFVAYHKDVEVYDVITGSLISTVRSPYYLKSPYIAHSAGIAVNNKNVIWELGLGRLIINECPKSLQQMIKEQTTIFDNEGIPEPERKKYFLDNV